MHPVSAHFPCGQADCTQAALWQVGVHPNVLPVTPPPVRCGVMLHQLQGGGEAQQPDGTQNGLLVRRLCFADRVLWFTGGYRSPQRSLLCANGCGKQVPMQRQQVHVRMCNPLLWECPHCKRLFGMLNYDAHVLSCAPTHTATLNPLQIAAPAPRPRQMPCQQAVSGPVTSPAAAVVQNYFKTGASAGCHGHLCPLC